MSRKIWWKKNIWIADPERLENPDLKPEYTKEEEKKLEKENNEKLQKLTEKISAVRTHVIVDNKRFLGIADCCYDDILLLLRIKIKINKFDKIYLDFPKYYNGKTGNFQEYIFPKTKISYMAFENAIIPVYIHSYERQKYSKSFSVIHNHNIIFCESQKETQNKSVEIKN